MIKQAKVSEVRAVAEELFAPIVAELREELASARREQSLYLEELTAVHTRLKALENNAQTARRRLDQRTDAVMKQLAKVENAAQAARGAS